MRFLPPRCKRDDDGKVIESCGWCGCRSSGVEHCYVFNVCGACGKTK